MPASSDRRRRRVSPAFLLAAAGFIFFAAMLVYPLASDCWNRYRDARLIREYDSQIMAGSPDILRRQWEAAEAYNRALAARTSNMVSSAMYEIDKEYEQLLDPRGNGAMGYIEIPRIRVNEFIYHYSDEEQLAMGTGHIHGSSLPVGGENTHCLITGHRGLPSQKFFSDLDQLQKGDTFFLHVLDQVLCYQVEDIRTVLPQEVDSLTIKPGRDLVTLVTCTPYGVNSHRLLVTGQRIPYSQNASKGMAGYVEKQKRAFYVTPLMAVMIGLACFLAAVLIIEGSRKIYEKRKKKDGSSSAASGGPLPPPGKGS